MTTEGGYGWSIIQGWGVKWSNGWSITEGEGGREGGGGTPKLTEKDPTAPGHSHLPGSTTPLDEGGWR
jgi:hypothetical protein